MHRREDIPEYLRSPRGAPEARSRRTSPDEMDQELRRQIRRMRPMEEVRRERTRRASPEPRQAMLREFAPESRRRKGRWDENEVRPDSRGGGYSRYRQPPPRERARRGGLFGTLVILALVVALGAGLTGWLKEQHRQEELRQTLRQYPLSYRGLIQRYAQERALEPCYIAAIIRAESSFQADATSAVNAQGLMQIMPDTGEWLAGKFGDTYTEGCLYDPETNIRYGCWYMGFLMKRYNGDKACSSAAYHSGQGTVDGWLKDPAYSADGKTLTVIPGENAKVYVDRVLNYYEKYKELYGVDLTGTPETAAA